MNALKKYKVVIFGETFSLISDESEAQVLKSAQDVDTLMRQIAERSGLADSRRIAVLAAVHYASRSLDFESMVQEYELKELQLVEHIDRELFPA